MAGGLGGLGGGTSATQSALMTGPTDAAAAAATQAQLTGINQAIYQSAMSNNQALNALQGGFETANQAGLTAAGNIGNAITQSGQSAIQSLMGNYQTALNTLSPSIGTGNQALAQLNWALGNPAIAPGAAPTLQQATAPTLQQATAPTLTSADYLNDFLQNSIQMNPAGPSTPGVYDYVGPGAGTTITTPNADINYSSLGFSGQNFKGSDQPGAILNIDDVLSDPTYSPLLKQELGTIDPKTIAYNQQQQANQQAYNQAQAAYTTQQATNEQTYQQQLAQYNQQQSIYNQYQAQGQATPDQINKLITNLPGFQFQQDQGISAIQNAGSASGMLNSSNLLQQLNQFGQSLSGTYYNNYLGQLSNLAQMGQSSSNAAAGLSQTTGQNLAGVQNSLGNALSNTYSNLGQQLAQSAIGSGQGASNLYSGLGDTLSNAYLSAGQASASGILAPLSAQAYRTVPIGESSSGGSGFGSLLSGAGSVLGAFGKLP